MPNKNIPDSYDKLITAITLLNNKIVKDLPEVTEAEFLESFGTQFQEQLSDAGKNILDQNVLNPALKIINKKFEENFSEITKALPNSFLDNQLDLDITLKNAQNELQKKLAETKKQLQQSFLKDLNDQGYGFTPKDKAELETAFAAYIDKNYTKLSNHLAKFKELPAIYTKYLLHEQHTEAQTKANKDISHSITRDPTLEELQSKPKPEPKVGYKVHKDNLAEQIQSDIAAGKGIDINITVPDQSAIFKRIVDIGYQHQKPALAVLYMIIFLITMYKHNNEKRAIQSIKDVIKEKQLFDLDLSKITLQMSTTTPNGNEKTIRKKGPLNPEQIMELQSMINENKKELITHHYSTKTNKKSGLTPTESGYNTEDEEEIPYSRPRP